MDDSDDNLLDALIGNLNENQFQQFLSQSVTQNATSQKAEQQDTRNRDRELRVMRDIIWQNDIQQQEQQRKLNESRRTDQQFEKIEAWSSTSNHRTRPDVLSSPIDDPVSQERFLNSKVFRQKEVASSHRRDTTESMFSPSSPSSKLFPLSFASDKSAIANPSRYASITTPSSLDSKEQPSLSMLSVAPTTPRPTSTPFLTPQPTPLPPPPPKPVFKPLQLSSAYQILQDLFRLNTEHGNKKRQSNVLQILLQHESADAAMDIDVEGRPNFHLAMNNLTREGSDPKIVYVDLMVSLLYVTRTLTANQAWSEAVLALDVVSLLNSVCREAAAAFCQTLLTDSDLCETLVKHFMQGLGTESPIVCLFWSKWCRLLIVAMDEQPLLCDKVIKLISPCMTEFVLKVTKASEDMILATLQLLQRLCSTESTGLAITLFESNAVLRWLTRLILSPSDLHLAAIRALASFAYNTGDAGIQLVLLEKTVVAAVVDGILNSYNEDSSFITNAEVHIPTQDLSFIHEAVTLLNYFCTQRQHEMENQLGLIRPSVVMALMPLTKEGDLLDEMSRELLRFTQVDDIDVDVAF